MSALYDTWMAPEMPAIRWLERQSEIVIDLGLLIVAALAIGAVFYLRGKPIAKAVLLAWFTLP